MNYKIESKNYQINVADKEATVLDCPKIVFETLKEDFNATQEEMYLITLNTKNKIIEKTLISKGAHNTLMITPMEIFRPLMLSNGNNFIIAHNHPSGDTQPSEEDITFTRKIKKASEIMGCNLLDHLVYSDTEYYSFKSEGLL